MTRIRKEVVFSDGKNCETLREKILDFKFELAVPNRSGYDKEQREEIESNYQRIWERVLAAWVDDEDDRQTLDTTSAESSAQAPSPSPTIDPIEAVFNENSNATSVIIDDDVATFAGNSSSVLFEGSSTAEATTVSAQESAAPQVVDDRETLRERGLISLMTS